MRAPRRIGGWLLVLCVLLLVWQPISLGLVAANALEALPIRGAPLAVLLLLRLLAAAVGIAAGLALLGRRPAAVALAEASLVFAALVDVVVYTTPYFPNNRPPGDTPLYVASSLAYNAGWLAYLVRSRRVADTFRDDDGARLSQRGR